MNRETIARIILAEEEQFERTVARGLRELEKIIREVKEDAPEV